MSNVAVTVQHDSGPAGLLGLYQGVPLTRRSTFYAGVWLTGSRSTGVPSARCATAIPRSSSRFGGRSFKVGHHFGIGDARLRELGW